MEVTSSSNVVPVQPPPEVTKANPQPTVAEQPKSPSATTDTVTVSNNSSQAIPPPASDIEATETYNSAVLDKPLPQSIKDEKQATQVAEDLQKSLNAVKTSVHFEVTPEEHQDTAQAKFNFQVVNKQTGEVIRQYPPDDIQAIKQKTLEAGLKGILVNGTG